MLTGFKEGKFHKYVLSGIFANQTVGIVSILTSNVNDGLIKYRKIHIHTKGGMANFLFSFYLHN
jgi:hypothetical protein